EGRFYPQGSFLSQTVGFLGGEGEGQYGLEEYWDGVLKGETGPGSGQFVFNDMSEGSDIILTIDYNTQYQAEKLLNKAGEDLKIENGEIIVMDPNSGKIIAMANFPNFNPNQYETYAKSRNLEIFQNSAIQKIFEPGSVFKAITMAAALNEGKITPSTTYIDVGQIKIGGSTVYNYDHRIWGEMTMTGVLERSINTGAVFAESQISHNTFLDYISRFGIFEKTGIDLPGEISSQNAELKKGYEINFATAAFGQGIEMTSLQFIRAYSAIANGGYLVKPYLVEEIVNSNGQKETIQSQIGKEGIISSETSSRLSAMLVSVVENGYSKEAQVPGYYIAGKTGTAQIPWITLGINKAGYSEKTYQSFVGFFPAFNPKFVVLVKLLNPQTKTAEYSAVPVFQELAKYIIDYYQIPPDHE
ncbi:MAG: penicillin-binding protein 2, partial [Candidatus Parcubacteria bacterium]|nr:penicillin-binding protein 2 [Candidatus Parcubacteria bacterium]